jgi:hypothetical protein
LNARSLAPHGCCDAKYAQIPIDAPELRDFRLDLQRLEQRRHTLGLVDVLRNIDLVGFGEILDPHQPRRRRERKTQGFKSPASARRFVAIHAAVYNVVNVQGHLIRRATLHSCRAEVYPACQSAQDWVPLIGVEKDWMPITPKTGSLSHCESQSSSISSPVGGCSLCNEK